MTDLPASLALGRVAAQIEAWADREQKLAGALAGCRPPLLPRDGVGLAVRAGSPSDHVSADHPPAHRNLGRISAGDCAPQTTMITVPVPPALTVEGAPLGHEPTVPSTAAMVAPAPLRTDASLDFDRALDPGPIGPALSSGPFDDLFDSFTGGTVPDRPLPPPDRFRVRVAQVPKAHRVTKRDYDYFKELDAALAARSERVDPADR